jgi:hypothetical protein
MENRRRRHGSLFRQKQRNRMVWDLVGAVHGLEKWKTIQVRSPWIGVVAGFIPAFADRARMNRAPTLRQSNNQAFRLF